MTDEPPAPADVMSGAENAAEAEGAQEAVDSADSMGSRSALMEAAFSTDPNRPLDQIEDPWNPEQGGLSRVYRGMMKAAGIDGLPAILDLGIGIVEWWQTFELEGGTEDSGGEPGRGAVPEQPPEDEPVIP